MDEKKKDRPKVPTELRKAALESLQRKQTEKAGQGRGKFEESDAAIQQVDKPASEEEARKLFPLAYGTDWQCIGVQFNRPYGMSALFKSESAKRIRAELETEIKQIPGVVCRYGRVVSRGLRLLVFGTSPKDDASMEERKEAFQRILEYLPGLEITNPSKDPPSQGGEATRGRG